MKVAGAAVLAGVFVVSALAGCAPGGTSGGASGSADGVKDAPEGWGTAETWVKPTETQLDPADFVEGVDNPYFPLVPGTEWIYEAETPDGLERIEVTVMSETRTVAGITCVVVRDTVSLDGSMIEDTYDWYAQDKTGNVWYMGEDSKEYENGKVTSTAGSWEAGVDGALPGIKVWVKPRVGEPAYYQELYAGQAEDLGRDVALDGKASTPAGEYSDLLVVEEWNKLDPAAVERKYYAAGVGTVMEDAIRGGGEVVKLVRIVSP